MRIVLDANIVIIALLGSRATVVILTSQNHKFYAPTKIIEEIKKCKQLICEKAEITEEEFELNLEALLKFITILEFIEYDVFMEQATELIGYRDIKDADYIACALAVCADFIWTNDKDFSVQERIKFKTTDEFIEGGK